MDLCVRTGRGNTILVHDVLNFHHHSELDLGRETCGFAVEFQESGCGREGAEESARAMISG